MKKAIFCLAVAAISSSAFAGETCKPTKGWAGFFGDLTVVRLDSAALAYEVSTVPAPGEKAQNGAFGALAIPSTREGFTQYSDRSQNQALAFWGSWNAPGDKITYDVENSVLEGKGGVIQVWGTEAPADNPTINGKPAIMGEFDCQ